MLALILGLSAGQAPDLAVEAFRLPNGLRVALHRDPGVPRATVCVCYHVGSKNERAGRTGFAHFFEHMMFRGTKRVPNFDVPLQEAGATSNAYTNEDVTVYHETVPSQFLERALYLEGERMAFLADGLDRRKFDTEREVVKNERRQTYENVPYGLAEEAILASVYPKGHPYSWSVIGSMRDLDAAGVDDLRRFFAEFYHPGNAAVAVVGDFDPAAARRWIERYFSTIPAGPAPAAVKAPATPAVAARFVQRDRVKFPRVYWAWPTVRDDHPDAPALDLLASVLAGGDASRLHRALVLDEPLAQEVGVDANQNEAGGFVQWTAICAPDAPVAKVEAALEAQRKRLATAPPTAAELRRVVAKYETATVQRMTNGLSRAILLATGFATKGDAKHYRTEYARYLAVTPADLARVAGKYFGPEKFVLEVRPIAPGEDQTPALLAGPAPAADGPAVAGRRPADEKPWSEMPKPGQTPEFSPPAVERFTLAGGSRVWFSPWRTLPLATFRVVMPMGSADDPAGRSGLAMLTASMLQQGTATRTAVEFAEEVERLGASLAVSAGPDEIDVEVRSLVRHAPAVMALVGEMLAKPRFDQKDFDRERDLRLAALEQGPDDPEWLAQRVYRSLLWGADHPYGRPADGTRRSLKALTLDDVRKFHAALGAKHARIVAVGDLSRDGAKALLEKALAGWTAPGSPPAARPASKAVPPADVVHVVDKPEAPQTILRLGRRWFARTDEVRYLPGQVANRALGGDFLGRLNQNLRERNGFTYGAGSSFGFTRDVGSWAAQTSVRTDATGAALRELATEIDALAGARPMADEEALLHRDGLLKSYPEEFETPSGILGNLHELASFGLPNDALARHPAALRAVDGAAVRRVAKELAERPGRLTVVVGDRARIEPLLEQAGFKKRVVVAVELD